jgi:hypothetical protein
MELTLAESTALSAKSEREYITLRDSIKHMTEGWKLDMAKLREEMNKKEKEWKDEAEAVGKNYQNLCKLVEEDRCVVFILICLLRVIHTLSRVRRIEAEAMKEEANKLDKEFANAFREQLDSFASAIEKSSDDVMTAKLTAECVRSHVLCAILTTNQVGRDGIGAFTTVNAGCWPNRLGERYPNIVDL